MTYDGDPKLQESGDGADLVIMDGQPEMDPGLQNAVYISLFTRTGWWGNGVATDDAERVGSSFEEIQSRTLTNATRLDAEELARQALAWMVTEGLAQSISVSGSIPRLGVLGLAVTIQQPNEAGAVTVRYSINWAELSAQVLGV